MMAEQTAAAAVEQRKDEVIGLAHLATPDRSSSRAYNARGSGHLWGLPLGWEIAVSRRTGEKYYANHTTGESQFDRPEYSANASEEEEEEDEEEEEEEDMQDALEATTEELEATTAHAVATRLPRNQDGEPVSADAITSILRELARERQREREMDDLSLSAEHLELGMSCVFGAEMAVAEMEMAMARSHRAEMEMARSIRAEMEMYSGQPAFAPHIVHFLDLDIRDPTSSLGGEAPASSGVWICTRLNL